MSFFLQELVNGITTGALYALVALGFSMVYGVLKLLNFAHGDLYMIGAYIGFFVIQWFGGSTALTIPVPLLLVIMFVLAAGLVGGLGVAIERFAYRPLRDAPRIAPLITAIGISFFLENSALLLFGAQPRIYNTPNFISLSSGIQIGSVTIDSVQILVLVLGLVLMVGLQQVVNRTRLGRQMRAVAADQPARQHEHDHQQQRHGDRQRGRPAEPLDHEETDVGPDHVQVPVGEVEQLQYPVDHGEAERDQCVERARGDAVHQFLQEEAHARRSCLP